MTIKRLRQLFHATHGTQANILYYYGFAMGHVIGYVAYDNIAKVVVNREGRKECIVVRLCNK